MTLLAYSVNAAAAGIAIQSVMATTLDGVDLGDDETVDRYADSVIRMVFHGILADDEQT